MSQCTLQLHSYTCLDSHQWISLQHMLPNIHLTVTWAEPMPHASHNGPFLNATFFTETWIGANMNGTHMWSEWMDRFCASTYIHLPLLVILGAFRMENPLQFHLSALNELSHSRLPIFSAISSAGTRSGWEEHTYLPCSWVSNSLRHSWLLRPPTLEDNELSVTKIL